MGIFPPLAFAEESNTEFAQCIEQLKQRALQENISDQVVEHELSRARYVARVIELDRKQPEFSQMFHGYFSQRVTEQRVQLGRQLLQQHQSLLKELTLRYGIPPQYLVAFWGMETNFGRYLGKMNVRDSLATLACDPRRSEFFTVELMEALRLIESGVKDGDAMEGSWAGAMGNMQFMPSAYRQFGLDGDQDGRTDLWGSLTDAFTSAAFYLQQLGWQRNWRWGREVILPEGFDYSLAGRYQYQPLSFWRQQGVRDIRNQLMPSMDAQAALVVPAGHEGPAFLVYSNFEVIMKWNRSEFYALSVGILADRINGAGQLRVTPPNQQAMTIEEVSALQTQLFTAGFDVGEIDGIFGSQTKRALRAFQKTIGIVADGYPNDETISSLQKTVLQKKNPPDTPAR